MSCRLLNNIKASCNYNTGGISEILLLDIRDFISYQFKNDKRHDECFVESVSIRGVLVNLGAINETSFSENKANGYRKQSLTTFIHTLESDKLKNILIAESNKYVVFFKTNMSTWFTFGSDGGTSISFNQISGKTGETNGYNIEINMDSVYPLFEIDMRNILIVKNKNLDKTFDKTFD